MERHLPHDGVLLALAIAAVVALLTLILTLHAAIAGPETGNPFAEISSVVATATMT